jgi:hypothetical protein
VRPFSRIGCFLPVPLGVPYLSASGWVTTVASFILLMAGIVTGVIVLATIVGKAVGRKIIARAEAAVGEKLTTPQA